MDKFETSAVMFSCVGLVLLLLLYVAGLPGVRSEEPVEVEEIQWVPLAPTPRVLAKDEVEVMLEKGDIFFDGDQIGPLTDYGDIIFQSDNYSEILRFESDGDIFWRGRKVTTDKQLVEGFKDVVAKAKYIVNNMMITDAPSN